MAPRPPLDLWDQALFTEFSRAAVDRVLAPLDRVAPNFAPLEPTIAEKIGKAQVKLKALGKAQGFLSDDATPPIYRPEIRFTEEAWTLARLAERTTIEESLLRALNNNGTDSDSKDRRDRAGVDILTRVRALAIRQEVFTDAAVMEAIITGELRVKFANPPAGDTSQEYAIDYEFPSGHLGVVSTSFADLTNGAPITVIRGIQNQLRTASGSYGIHLWMSSEVEQMILGSKQVRDSIFFNAPTDHVGIVTREHANRLLYEPDKVVWHVTDEGWFDETAGYETQLDSSRTRWIPTNRLIVTTEDPYRGDRIAQTFDGMVPVPVVWNGPPQYRGPGPQTYTKLLDNLTTVVHQECRRLPMIQHPECIASWQVVL